MEKKKLRKLYLDMRKSLSAEEALDKSLKIHDQLFELADFSSLGYVHIFLAMQKFREVDTWKLIHRIWREYPDVKVVIPVMDSQDRLRHYIYHDDVKVKPNAFGVPEPVAESTQVPPLKIDLVIVPLLVFDDRGYRIGYGKGYYDRFLSELREDCVKVGVAFDLSHSTELIPAENHDVPLDMVVTESKIYKFT